MVPNCGRWRGRRQVRSCPWRFLILSAAPCLCLSRPRQRSGAAEIRPRRTRRRKRSDWDGLFADGRLDAGGRRSTMPASTGAIDGRRFAFTGDNIFASTTDAAPGRKRIASWRNATGGRSKRAICTLADYLHTINPDLIVWRSLLAARPARATYRRRFRTQDACLMREAFRNLTPRKPIIGSCSDPYSGQGGAVPRGGRTERPYPPSM